MKRNKYKFVCSACRKVVTIDPCPICNQETLLVSSDWRIPRSNNNAAWKMIQAGDIMWDKHAVERGSRHAFPSSLLLDKKKVFRWMK